MLILGVLVIGIMALIGTALLLDVLHVIVARALNHILVLTWVMRRLVMLQVALNGFLLVVVGLQANHVTSLMEIKRLVTY